MKLRLGGRRKATPSLRVALSVLLLPLFMGVQLPSAHAVEWKALGRKLLRRSPPPAGAEGRLTRAAAPKRVPSRRGKKLLLGGLAHSLVLGTGLGFIAHKFPGIVEKVQSIEQSVHFTGITHSTHTMPGGIQEAVTPSTVASYVAGSVAAGVVVSKGGALVRAVLRNWRRTLGGVAFVGLFAYMGAVGVTAATGGDAPLGIMEALPIVNGHIKGIVGQLGPTLAHLKTVAAAHPREAIAAGLGATSTLTARVIEWASRRPLEASRPPESTSISDSP